MKRKLFPILLALLLLVGCTSQTSADQPIPDQAPPTTEEAPVQPQPTPEPEPQPEPEPEPEPTVATLAVCGDAMSHMPVTNDALTADGVTYDYRPIMAGAADLVGQADFAVCNLETTLGEPPYSGYPNFRSPAAMAEGLRDTGFDLVLTANNHSLDTRWAGVQSTLDVLDEAGLAHVGTSRTQEEFENNIVVADVGGIDLAFLGYAYGTNGIPLPKDAPYAVNLFNTDYLTSMSTLDTEKLAADLAAAQALDTDLVAVMIHWGWEYHTTQNSYQEEIADFLIANGADLILGGHSHVLQPFETRTVTLEDGTTREGFVSYSLGNFISSQTKPLTDTTAVLTLELTKDPTTGETAVTDCSYAPMFMLHRDGGERRFELIDAYTALDTGELEPGLEKRLTQAIEDCHAVLGTEADPRYVAEPTA